MAVVEMSREQMLGSEIIMPDKCLIKNLAFTVNEMGNHQMV